MLQMCAAPMKLVGNLMKALQGNIVNTSSPRQRQDQDQKIPQQEQDMKGTRQRQDHDRSVLKR